MKRILLLVLLLTNYTAFGQTKICPDANLTITGIYDDKSQLWDEYGVGLNVCQGTNISLIANYMNRQAKSISWIMPDGSKSKTDTLFLKNVSTKHMGVYQLTVVFTSDCADSVITVTETIKVDLPRILVSDQNICEGTSVQLNYSLPYDWPYREYVDKSKITVQWTGPDNFKSTENKPTIQNLKTSGVYTASVSFSGFCIGAYNTSIKINVKKQSQVEADEIYVCTGGEAKLTAKPLISGAQGKYVWKGPNGFTEEGQTIIIKNVSKAQEGAYKVFASFEGGCSGTDSTFAILNVNQPTVVFNDIIDFCEGATVALPSVRYFDFLVQSQKTTYKWTGPNGFQSNEAIPFIRNFTKANKGLYNVEINVSGSCVGTIRKSFYIDPIKKPVVNSVSKTLCKGSSLSETLNFETNLNGITSIVWQGPNNFSATGKALNISNFDTSKAGIYTAIITNSGCPESERATVELKMATTRTVTSKVESEKGFCKGSIVRLYANDNPYEPNSSFSWTGPNGFKSSGKQLKINDLNENNSGTYTITVISNNCPAATGTVNIPIAKGIEVNLASTVKICEGGVALIQPVFFNANFNQDLYGASSYGKNIAYQWTGPNNFKTESQSLLFKNFNKNQEGEYEFKAFITGKCEGVISKKINITKIDPEIFLAFNEQCNGDIRLSPSFSVPLNQTWYGYKIFDTNNQEVTNPISANKPGIYTVEATLAGACNTKVVKQLDTRNAKPFGIIMAETVNKCLGNYFYLMTGFNESAFNIDNKYYELTSTATRIYFNWNGPDGATSQKTYIDVNKASKKNEGTYTVKATLAGECTGSYESTTKVIIDEEKPNVDFAITQKEKLVSLQNKTLGNVSSYFWDFGNGQQSKNTIPDTIAFADSGTYTISLTATNSCGTSIVSRIITITKEEKPTEEKPEEPEKVLSIENKPELLNFTISPNPSAGMVEISNPNKLDVRLIIYTIDGKTVDMLEMDKSQNTIQYDFNNYSSGIYLIKCIQKNGETRTRKIVISK